MLTKREIEFSIRKAEPGVWGEAKVDLNGPPPPAPPPLEAPLGGMEGFHHPRGIMGDRAGMVGDQGGMVGGSGRDRPGMVRDRAGMVGDRAGMVGKKNIFFAPAARRRGHDPSEG